MTSVKVLVSANSVVLVDQSVRTEVKNIKDGRGLRQPEVYGGLTERRARVKRDRGEMLFAASE